MSIIVGGAGIGLPQPYTGYNPPSPVGGSGTNQFTLVAGSSVLIPSGKFFVIPGRYSLIQVLNPLTGLWTALNGLPYGSPQQIQSDGANYRIYNPTGTPIGATITNAGSGYTSTPVVTASAGGSTWAAIVGGNVTSTTIVTAGSGFTIPPIVAFSLPPPGGLPAAGYAVLSGGTVASITLTHNGAGYKSAPTVFFQQDPNDTSISIVLPTATSTLSAGGNITAVYPTAYGTNLTAVPTLTFSGGGGSAAAATAICAFAITTVTVGTAGATIIGSAAQILTVGGLDTTAAASNVANPVFGASRTHVRPANIYAPVTGGALGTPVVVDAGIFEVAPAPVVVQQSGAAPGTAPVVTFAIGGVNDSIFMTPC